MPFEINKEFATAQGLSDEQVSAITGNVTEWHTTDLATEKLAWDNKANTDAEAILNGAILATQEVNKFKLERNTGEKVGDYLSRYSSELLKGRNTEIDGLKTDYENKLKDFKGDEATAQELKEIRDKYDEAQKKYADYDTLKEGAGKYETLNEKYEGMKLEVAFTDSKPQFPDTVNKFEADTRWNECKAKILKDYTIERVEDKSIAISKENQHIQKPLEDLINKDEQIAALMAGRQQNGVNNQQVKSTIEGVPFEVPVKMTTKERSNLIASELLKQGLNLMSDEYALKFEDYYNKITKQQTA